VNAFQAAPRVSAVQEAPRVSALPEAPVSACLLIADMEMDAAVELLCANLPREDLAALSSELGAPGTADSEPAKQAAVQARRPGWRST
jgi:hypothetical protein